MADRQLLEPILDGGIAHANFLNGYLLTAESLRTEQDAQDTMHRYLAQAVGQGVVYGLEVSRLEGESERLGIAKGLALNGQGQLLHLSQEVVLKLTGVESGLEEASDPCADPESDTFYSAPGYYLLVASPAAGYLGQAPMYALAGQGAAPSCGKAKLVDGLRFRLIDLGRILGEPPSLGSGNVHLDRFALRNRIAATLIGAQSYFEELTQTPGVLCQSVESIDSVLADPDVPLAVVHWADGGVQFVETWAARRPPVPVRPWPLRLPIMRHAEMQALTMHFRCLTRELLDVAASLTDLHPPQLEARNTFTILPAAGYLSTGASEFDADKFFAGFHPIETDCIDKVTLRRHAEHAWLAEPIDLEAASLPEISYVEVAPGLTFFMRYDPPCGDLHWVSEQPAGPSADEESTPSAGEEVPPVQTEPTGTISLLLGVIGDLPLGYGKGFFTEASSLEVYAINESSKKKYSPIRISEGDLDKLLTELALGGTRTSVSGSKVDAVAKKAFGGQSPHALFGYVFNALPAGLYKFYAKAKGHQSVNTSKRVYANQNGQVTLLLDLTIRPPQSGDLGRKPKKDYVIYADGRWIEPNWWDEIWIPGWEIKPWDPSFDLGGGIPIPDPARYEPWFIHLMEELDSRFPGVPVDLTFYLDPAYTPGGAVPATPYAYLRFGELCAPVILATDAASTSLGKAGLGLLENRSGGEALKYTGLDRVEILAGAWSGLIVEVMGVGADSAREIVSEASHFVASAGGLSGLDADIATKGKLGEKGYHNSVSVANADPAKLAEDAGLDIMEAIDLVEGARKEVPKDAWDLDIGALGLEPDELAGLKELGITTQGQLQIELESDDTGTAVLGDRQSSVNENLTAHKNGLAAGYGAKVPVYRVVGIGGTEAHALAAGGITSLSGMFATDNSALANLVYGDSSPDSLAKADKMITDAGKAMNNLMW